MLALLLLVLAGGDEVTKPSPDFWRQFRLSIENNLGRPYSWGACGRKSYDCSGFVWRVMWENGVPIKRTTARKLYMSLPKTSQSDQLEFGNVVFFDNLKHCGIVNNTTSFYHAESSKGTTMSPFNSYWRGKVCGFRRVPKP